MGRDGLQRWVRVRGYGRGVLTLLTCKLFNTILAYPVLGLLVEYSHWTNHAVFLTSLESLLLYRININISVIIILLYTVIGHNVMYMILLMYIARHESILMSAGHSFVVFLVSNALLIAK